jgi:SAM-dependent methyltransferase
LAENKPDYSIYNDDDYLGDIWACWIIYSRSYLKNINNPKSLFNHSIVQDMGNINKIADLGCGFGYTTAALSELFPSAKVIGTNLPNTKQTIFAKNLSKKYNFELAYNLKDIGKVDLIFASEYFEHFYKPIEHLSEVMKYLQPEYLLIANAFGSKSIGHFDEYEANGQIMGNKIIGRYFNHLLIKNGYRKIKTKMWNNRPNYWKKE